VQTQTTSVVKKTTKKFNDTGTEKNTRALKDMEKCEGRKHWTPTGYMPRDR